MDDTTAGRPVAVLEMGYLTISDPVTRMGPTWQGPGKTRQGPGKNNWSDHVPPGCQIKILVFWGIFGI